MFENIFHPTDFTETSQIAFSHALRIAIGSHAELKLLHVNVDGEGSHHRDFPSIRETLERWQMLPEGSHRRAVSRLGIDVNKTIVPASNPVQAISEFLYENPSSLIVLASHDRSKPFWFGHSKAEPISRNAQVTTLFVPDGVPGFVSIDKGEVKLNRILIPVAAQPSAAVALESVIGLIETMQPGEVDIHFLHVGEQSTLPALPHQAPAGVRYHVHVEQGDVVAKIVEKSLQWQVHLVAMVTDGHHSFLDALRGNTTERVLRQIECPLWAVSDD